VILSSFKEIRHFSVLAAGSVILVVLSLLARPFLGGQSDSRLFQAHQLSEPMTRRAEAGRHFRMQLHGLTLGFVGGWQAVDWSESASVIAGER
jgi:hypothetical protein